MSTGPSHLREDRRLPWIVLGAVIVIFAAFAIAYTRITPIGASPDELSHLNYIGGIANHFQLPPAGQPERQQPPLYYLLGALLSLMTGGDPRLIRLLSVALGVLTILTVYLIGRRLFPNRPALAVGAAAIVALLPETQYLAGAINDDNLAWLAGALLVLAGVVVLQSNVLTNRLALGAGLAVALGALAKETVWLLALLLLAVVVVRFWSRIRPLQAAALVVPSILLAGWWFVRNAVQFGSPLPPLHPITSQRQVFNSLTQVRGYLAATAVSMVGMYGNGAHFVAISILGTHPLPSWVAGAAIGLLSSCGGGRGCALVAPMGCAAATNRAVAARRDPCRGGAVGDQLGDVRPAAAGTLSARRGRCRSTDRRVDAGVAALSRAVGAAQGRHRSARGGRPGARRVRPHDRRTPRELISEPGSGSFRTSAPTRPPA